MKNMEAGNPVEILVTMPEAFDATVEGAEVSQLELVSAGGERTRHVRIRFHLIPGEGQGTAKAKRTDDNLSSMDDAWMDSIRGACAVKGLF